MSSMTPSVEKRDEAAASTASISDQAIELHDRAMDTVASMIPDKLPTYDQYTRAPSSAMGMCGAPEQFDVPMCGATEQFDGLLKADRIASFFKFLGMGGSSKKAETREDTLEIEEDPEQVEARSLEYAKIRQQEEAEAEIAMKQLKEDELAKQRKIAEEKEALLKQEKTLELKKEEDAKKLAEEKAALIKREKAMYREKQLLAEEKEETRRQAKFALKVKKEEEAQALKLKKENEALALKHKKEEEARKLAEEKEAKKQEALALKLKEEEEARKVAEEKTRKLVAEKAAKKQLELGLRLRKEEEARQLAEEKEARRMEELKKAAEALKLAEEKARKKKEEREEAKKQAKIAKAEAEEAKKAAKEAAKATAEAEARAAAGAKAAKKQAKEEAKAKAKADAQARAAQVAQAKADELTKVEETPKAMDPVSELEVLVDDVEVTPSKEEEDDDVSLRDVLKLNEQAKLIFKNRATAAKTTAAISEQAGSLVNGMLKKVGV